MSNKRFLVVGSNSFSGSHCVNHLLRKGFEVWGISRSAEPNKIFLPYKSLDKVTLKRFFFKSLNLKYDLNPIL